MGKAETRDDLPRRDVFDRLVANRSGVLDIRIGPETNWLFWFVVEDRQDICSVGLSADDARNLIAYLQKAIACSTEDQ